MKFINKVTNRQFTKNVLSPVEMFLVPDRWCCEWYPNKEPSLSTKFRKYTNKTVFVVSFVNKNGMVSFRLRRP